MVLTRQNLLYSTYSILFRGVKKDLPLRGDVLEIRDGLFHSALTFLKLSKNFLRMISYNVIDIKMPDISHRETTAWVRAVAATYGKRVGEVAYIFCNDDKILEVNRQYLQHDYFTDIITFDYCEGDMISGDLFISLDTVRSNAELFNKTYDEELHRVIIHGILHLVGINDKGPGEREIMEAAENKALELLKEMQAEK